MSVVRMHSNIPVRPEVLLAQLQELDLENLAVIYIEKGDTQCRACWTFMQSDRLVFLGASLDTLIRREILE